jgi:thiol-disulfide isomerase/thioredoxin
MRRLCLTIATIWTVLSTGWTAPVSPKELDLMVRMRLPDAEIAADVKSRGLLKPMDAATEDLLLKSGASPVLLRQLKAGSVVSEEEAARVQRLQAQSQAAAAQGRAADEAAAAAHRRGLVAAVPGSDKMKAMFDGKLVRYENGSLRPYEVADLRHIRYYLLYYSAHWCGPCRKFTPELVSFYHQFKAKNPEIEVIFISSDYSAQDMEEYMKSTGMPWPAVRHDAVDKNLRSLAGSGIPWLGIYSDAAEPISSNGRDKKWVNPAAVITAFAEAIAKAKATR